MIDSLIALGIIEGGVGAVIGGAVGHVFAKRRYKQRLIDEWYRESLGLIERYKRLGRRVTEYQEIANYELFLNEVEPLADNVADHVGRGREIGVPKAASRDLTHLSHFATGLAILVQKLGEEEAAEFLSRTISQSEERLGDSAQEIEIEDLDDFLQNFDIDEINRRSGINPEDFDKETANQVLEPVDERELTQAVESVWGENDTFPESGKIDQEKGAAVSQIFQIDFHKIEEHLDSVMDATMTEYIRAVMVDYADGVSERMERRRS